LVHLLAEREVLVLHPLLGTLSIVDVGARREPADDSTIGIAQRRAAAEDPPILSICSPQAKLDLAPDPFREPADGRPHGVQVFRMDDFGPDVGVCDGLLEGPSGELEGGAVRVSDEAIGVAHDEKLGKEVDDRTELALVLPDALLRLASVVDVYTDAHPASDPPVGVADRQATTKVPTVLPVSPAQRRLI